MPSKEEYFDPAQPQPVDAHWLPWLKKELEIKGYEVHVPAMPEPYAPNYEKWKSVFESIPCDDETILVGHSGGAGFIVRWLSEHDINVGQVFLVAPWIDPVNELKNDFFSFTIDQDLVDKTKGIEIFISDDDENFILQSVEKIKVIKNIKIKQFKNRGHFDDFAGATTFPELLEEIIK